MNDEREPWSKSIVCESDELPLFISRHPRSDAWKTRIPYIGLLGNKMFDWFYVRLHRPRLSDESLENIKGEQWYN